LDNYDNVIIEEMKALRWSVRADKKLRQGTFDDQKKLKGEGYL